MSLLIRALSATAICVALTVSASAADDIQERTIRWGHLNNTDHPVSFGVQKFAEILLAKSGGKMKVREFAASQLGNELQQQSALRGGTQEMLSASTSVLPSTPERVLIVAHVHSASNSFFGRRLEFTSKISAPYGYAGAARRGAGAVERGGLENR